VNWFSAPGIYKKYVDEVFNVDLAKGGGFWALATATVMHLVPEETVPRLWVSSTPALR